MPTALELLQTIFGHPQFRGPQQAIVDRLVSGGDALVLMPTGGGKSMCYQIPSLLRPGVGVVVSPLIALMEDQVAALREVGVRAAFLNSTVSSAEVGRLENTLRQGELDLLYVAPERLLMPRTLSLLDNIQVALFAIDEAHCVSQWGHDFRPEYLQLSVLHQRYPQVPRIALTATADELTRQEIKDRLDLGSAEVYLSSFDRPNIRYTVVDKNNPRRQLLDFLGSHRGDAGIVYCLSRAKVDETAAWLAEQGFTALPYHAGLDAGVRRRNQERFLREDGVVMAATIAFGMGIDKPDVRFVAHLDLPKSLESYYQETGRAGRDGAPAQAWMAYGLSDVVQQRRMIDTGEAPDTHKRVSRHKLDALLGYCEAPSCRRQRLLAYFGENAPLCGNCDLCLNPPRTWDGTVAAQKALSCIYRTGQRFGAVHVIDVLLGHNTDRIRQWRHDQLSTYGIGQDLPEATWRAVLRQLVNLGLLDVDLEGHGALRLTEASRAVLKGQQTVTLREVAPTKKEKREKLEKRKTQFEDIADQGLFEALRKLRQELAQSHNVPAYVIFHDSVLVELVNRRPASRDALTTVPGIGQAKLERYGDALMSLLREFY